ncbi:ATP-binding protein [Methylomonas montana]|uniref:AAA family ATPase n=1 Tax=Methylomonas montana TaxID=3058963 RepID=UPI00265A3250|nr:ATP-binding protein [Methylomonas montana]WKJ88595.1 ATP-binding protein [Methylomonas montana]
MAVANQIKALLKSHVDGDDAMFLSIAMQMAAQEAKKGHGNLAKEIRDLIDSAKGKPRVTESKAIPLAKPKGELSQLLNVSYPQLRLVDMVLSGNIQGKLERLIKEHKHVQKLRAHGLSPRKKLLLVGPPGTGKTMTASILAGELGLPLFIVRLESLMTKYMGETAGKLRLIFDAIEQTRGVYLFDEFDSIGSQRGNTNDVGEIRRVLNSFLQMIEQDGSDSLLIAATNHQELLDHALFRRFDDLIEYELPAKDEIIEAIKSKLASYKTSRIYWSKAAEAAETLSYGDITRACEDAIKDAIIHNKEVVSHTDLIHSIKERRLVRQKQQITL